MSANPYTVGIYTLGCKVNQYESEAIAERFSELGCRVQSPTSICDIYIINTCTVTAESDRKARQFIRRAIKNNPNAYVLVTGCFSQTQPQAFGRIAGIDYICGNADKQSVVDAALALCKSGQKSETATICCPPPDAYGFERMKISHFDRTRAYVKIEDGCESHCTYCIIPMARGKIRSKTPNDVMAEVRELTNGGCREIVLTGIETASYGKDLGGYNLADLLTCVDAIPNIGRIRLGSLDPSLFKQPFVDRIKALRSLTPHFHLSIQSGSDRILALMKRKYNRRMALEAIERLRRAIPDVQFTTDIIVGFPGETDADFADTLAFAAEAKFLMIHVFPYSKRQGTPAAAMPEQISEQVKHTRVKALSALQAEIRSTLLAEQIGKIVQVLFESYKNGLAVGHTPNFVEVACPFPTSLHNQTLSIRIVGSDSDRCYGEILDP